MPRPQVRDTRILSLWLPYLSTDRLARLARRISLQPVPHKQRLPDPGEAPVIVVEQISNALRVRATNAVAQALGLAPGMPLADARAIAGALAVHQADPGADLVFLNGIADWCDRYTPLVALDALDAPDAGKLSDGGNKLTPGDGLYLDISGCAHLFGGEQSLRDDLLARLAAQGLEARAAIASTAGAAWALARYGPPDVQAAFVARGAESGVLADLPMAALRLDGAQLALLDRLGLKRIGQLAGKPRAPLAKRFGAGLLRRFDQALGRENEPLSPRRPAPILMAERRFAEPVSGADGVAATIRDLADQLDPVLEGRGMGARLVELSLFRTDNQVVRAAVGTARPVRDAATIVSLFYERLDALGET
ncbi:MAG: Y-family DNA polymerase, partial [Alphaproteobacteria bacterium]